MCLLKSVVNYAKRLSVVIGLSQWEIPQVWFPICYSSGLDALVRWFLLSSLPRIVTRWILASVRRWRCPAVLSLSDNKAKCERLETRVWRCAMELCGSIDSKFPFFWKTIRKTRFISAAFFVFYRTGWTWCRFRRKYFKWIWRQNSNLSRCVRTRVALIQKLEIIE